MQTSLSVSASGLTQEMPQITSILRLDCLALPSRPVSIPLLLVDIRVSQNAPEFTDVRHHKHMAAFIHKKVNAKKNQEF